LKTYKKAGLGYMMAIGPGVHMEFCTCNIMPRKAEKEIKKEEKLLATVISR